MSPSVALWPPLVFTQLSGMPWLCHVDDYGVGPEGGRQSPPAVLTFTYRH
jgi:hypothetical protein